MALHIQIHSNEIKFHFKITFQLLNGHMWQGPPYWMVLEPIALLQRILLAVLLWSQDRVGRAGKALNPRAWVHDHPQASPSTLTTASTLRR